MQDSAYNFLIAILGTEGASALKKASQKEPGLEMALVPRAALAWVAYKTNYEGIIPGIDNSYLKLAKNGTVYTGIVSIGEISYEFKSVTLEHAAAAIAAGAGAELRKNTDIRDITLNRLGKGIDALVKAQLLVKKVLDATAGYKISHEETPSGLKVHAHDKTGNHVGTAWFTHTDTHIKPITVGVDEDHQRKGLATAMYNHARSLTGKQILPGDVQTDEGQGFRSTFKTELPGQTARAHKPTEPEGPMAPAGPSTGATQLVGPKLPKPPKNPKGSPKMPSLSIGKSEANAPCEACGCKLFKNDRFTGCMCWRDLKKHAKTIVYKDGYVLEFSPEADRTLILAFNRTLRGE